MVHAIAVKILALGDDGNEVPLYCPGGLTMLTIDLSKPLNETFGPTMVTYMNGAGNVRRPVSGL